MLASRLRRYMSIALDVLNRARASMPFRRKHRNFLTIVRELTQRLLETAEEVKRCFQSKKRFTLLCLRHFTVLNQVVISAAVCNKHWYASKCCSWWLGFSACISEHMRKPYCSPQRWRTPAWSNLKERLAVRVGQPMEARNLEFYTLYTSFSKNRILRINLSPWTIHRLQTKWKLFILSWNLFPWTIRWVRTVIRKLRYAAIARCACGKRNGTAVSLYCIWVYYSGVLL